jgi:hypothetical protein
MGLSDEERLLKFFNRLMWWRQTLVKLHAEVEKGPMYVGDGSPKQIVKRWIDTLDSMAGSMVMKLDSSSAYWLLGENEGNYRSLVTDPHMSDLASPVSDEDDDPVRHGSLHYWMDHLSLLECTKRWTGGKYECGIHVDRDCVKRVALWWEQWQQVDAVLYPVNRYRDKLFRPIRDTLNRLLGEMVNLRYAVVLRGSMPSDASMVNKVEGALLSRFRIVHNLLREEDKKLTSEFAVIFTPKASAKRRKAYFTRWNEDDFDVQKLIEQVGNMTLVQVAKYLKDEASKNYDDKNKRNAEERAKAQKDKRPDGILGATPRSKAELERIVQESKDADAIEQATQELEEVYHAYWSLGRSRIEKEGLRKQPPVPEKKLAPTKPAAKGKAKR